MITLKELRELREKIKGLCLYMEPEKLLEHGAEVSCPDKFVSIGKHPFGCFSSTFEADIDLWFSMNHDPGPNRISIPPAALSGNPNWISGQYFFHPGQFWVVPKDAIVVASRIDRTTDVCRNRIDVGALPQISDFWIPPKWRQPDFLSLLAV